MALILEIRDARGHPSWHPLDRLPLTLGRALSNDIIIDDPYADGMHARISLDDTGTVVIEDAGTVNGIIVNGERTPGPIRLGAGTQLRMGRTAVCVRARDEEVPSALYDSGDAPPPGLMAGTTARVAASPIVDGARTGANRSRLTRWSEWVLETTMGRATIFGAVLGAVALSSVLGHTEKDLGMDVFVVVLVTAAFLLIWSSIWALATRGADRRLRLMGHVAVASLVTLVLLVYSTVEEWLKFLFPDAGLLEVLSWLSMLVSVAWLIAAHLSVPKQLTRQKRWRAGLIVSGVLVAIVGVGTILGDDEFSDVPAFSQQLKRMPSTFVPTTSTDQFLDVMRDVKARADEAAAAPEAAR